MVEMADEEEEEEERPPARKRLPASPAKQEANSMWDLKIP